MNSEYPEQALAPSERERLAASLADYARQRRWFRAKSRTVSGARVADVVPLETSALVILEIGYRGETDRDLYAVPLARVSDAAAVRDTAPHAVVAELDEGGALVDTLASGQLGPALLALLRHGRAIAGESGRVRGEADPLFTELVGAEALAVNVPRGEQTNSSLVFGDRLLLKVYRQLSAGENPELEVGRYLTAHCQPPCAPRVLGALTYQGRDGESRSLGIAHELLANQGDAWTLALREVREFFAQVEGGAPPRDESPVDGGVVGLALARSRPSVEAVERFCALADVLGRRTGELHLALASDTADPAFAPEPLTATDRRALSVRAQAMLDENLGALGRVASRLPQSARMLAERLLAPEGRQAIIEVVSRFRDSDVAALKTRTHGDLHLGQVLVRPGDPVDFVIIDFEGEPGRPLPERRARSSPLRDVMAMARSFDYAPQAVLRTHDEENDDGTIRARREPWARLWTREVTAAYLRGYFQVVKDAPFLPARREELILLCRYYELEKVIYELGYEANNRPDWLEIPVRGLASVAAVAAAGSDR